jgi:ribosome-binding factor A
VSHRTEQLASELRGAIQEVIDRGLSDPRVSGMITVTEVRVSPDHKAAFIRVSVLPADRQKLTMHGLRAAAAHIRRQAGERVRTRSMPEIHFELDESTKKQAEVMGAIARATAERELKEGLTSGPTVEEPENTGPDPAYAQDRPRLPESR